MSFRDNCRDVLRAADVVTARLNEKDVLALCDNLVAAGRVFLLGLGRSGLVLKMFAVRLGHMGLHVHVIGETTIPPAHTGDLLVVCSASGRTASTLSVVMKARELGLDVVLLTAAVSSPMASLASQVIHFDLCGEASNEFEQGTIFERAVFVVLEAAVPLLMSKLGLSDAEMRSAHANLEYW